MSIRRIDSPEDLEPHERQMILDAHRADNSETRLIRAREALSAQGGHRVTVLIPDFNYLVRKVIEQNGHTSEKDVLGVVLITDQEDAA